MKYNFDATGYSMNNIKPFGYKTGKGLPGQIFTPAPLASFMISFFKDDIRDNHHILDPCIGPNTFFSLLGEIDASPGMTGIELDASLIDKPIRSFYSKRKRQLIVDSFFDLPLTKKFDYIIQNPPYIRQELMMHGKNAKAVIANSMSSLPIIIPKNANLYVHFLLKSIFHLRDGGRMIALIYDSWLYSRFGDFLKKSLLQFGSIESIYHFKKNAFPDADVGATVIDFKKINPSENRNILLYSFENANNIHAWPNIKSTFKKIAAKNFNAHRFSEEPVLNFKEALFTPIKTVSSQPVQRGTPSVVNQFFVHDKKIFAESIPFVKDVTSIDSFSVDKRTSYLLALNGHITEKAKKHLTLAKENILANSGKFRSLKNKINENRNWYAVQLKKPGNILFNYYLRKNIDFILNDDLYYASDNFYILNIEKNVPANFAVLNSTFTRIAILYYSRNQGKGLRKIQLYEFKQIPVIDCSRLSAEALIELEKMGRKLKNVSRFSDEKEKTIRYIDEVLLDEYNHNKKNKITMQGLYENISNMFAQY